MYGPGHYDLAGFAVGIIERANLPDPAHIRPGDLVLGLPSSGIHSNGYSLVRKVIAGLPLDQDPGSLGTSLGEAALRPTRIYVRELLTLFRQYGARGAAHITGGGLPGNLPRCLPDGLGARLFRAAWEVPPIFRFLEERGAIDRLSMDRTFNQGIGMCVVLPPEKAIAAMADVGGSIIGEVVEGDGVEFTP